MSAHSVPRLRPRPWTLGAVLDEEPLAPDSQQFIVRPDAPPAAARDFERRLLDASLPGRTRFVVQLVSGRRLSGPMVAALARLHRKLDVRRDRLIVLSDDPEVRHSLGCAGLDVSDPGEEAAP
jgi:hypothetical protein